MRTVILLVTLILASVDSISFPPRIKKGDLVGFLSPASSVQGSVQAFKAKVEASMSQLGLKVLWSKHAFGPADGYLASSDEDRASDVMAMFMNSSVKAIISTRGGWGTNRILEMIDYGVISKNAKLIMGYSDLTGLLNAITHKTGLVTFHGPMGVDSWNNWNSKYFQSVVFDAQMVTFTNQDNHNTTTVKSGKAKGRLIGGNLSVFVAMIGSMYLPNPRVAQPPFILFLEDVGEASYRLDRMLTQLHLSGFLNAASGIVWGRCTNCDEGGFTVAQVLQQKFQNLNVPIFTGAMTGHIAEQFILPIGLEVEMDADKGTIRMLEPALV